MNLEGIIPENLQTWKEIMMMRRQGTKTLTQTNSRNNQLTSLTLWARAPPFSPTHFQRNQGRFSARLLLQWRARTLPLTSTTSPPTKKNLFRYSASFHPICWVLLANRLPHFCPPTTTSRIEGPILSVSSGLSLSLSLY